MCKLGQPAEVTIDAIPRKVFHGVVTEIGNNAIVRSTGVATSQQASTSQEAKDFKVVVTLHDPPPDLRPGLSSTAKITTATRARCADDSDSGPDRPQQVATWSERSARPVEAAAAPQLHPKDKERTTSRVCS